jgi:hypothetical protein
MNHLRKYLKNNTIINAVHTSVFNQKPMVIDHIAHRTFKNDKVSHNYAIKYGNFKLMNQRLNFNQHNVYAEWWDNVREKNLYNEKQPKEFIGTPKLFISTYKGLDVDINLKGTSIDLERIKFHIDYPESIMPYSLYRKVWEKNQYLAWTLIHRNDINHLAILVDDIEDICKKVSEIIPLHNQDNPIQVSEDGDLLQFSTKPSLISKQFEEGFFSIPHNFVEFIQRKNDRRGFSEKNANVIFNSTK